MAPEFSLQGQLSAKADVYSFDVLLLEIISAKKNSEYNSAINVQSLLGGVVQKGATIILKSWVIHYFDSRNIERWTKVQCKITSIKFLRLILTSSMVIIVGKGP